MTSKTVIAISISLALAAALVAAGAGCSRESEASVTIHQLGSTTLLPLAEQWREAFNQEYPNVEIAVSGGGSGTGIRDLLAGSAEIANASRPMKQKERNQAQAASISPVEYVVAHDGLAVIVHPSNPLDELSIEQIAAIFAGAVNNWNELGGPDSEIVIINRDSSSGTWQAFKDLVLNSREYAVEALAMPANQAVLDSVSRYQGTIGYVGLGYLNESVKTLKVIPPRGGAAVEPTVANVQRGTYPISRALYCYTNGEPAGELGDYIQWIKGPAGQAIVAELGYVPVPE